MAFDQTCAGIALQATFDRLHSSDRNLAVDLQERIRQAFHDSIEEALQDVPASAVAVISGVATTPPASYRKLADKWTIVLPSSTVVVASLHGRQQFTADSVLIEARSAGSYFSG